MSPKSALLLKVLLNRFHPGEGEAFFKNLPQEQAKAINTQNTPSGNIAAALYWKRDLVARTHYSWFAPILSPLPKPMQKILLAAFPAYQASGIQKILKLEPISAEITEPVKEFLIEQFYNYWKPQDAIPYQYLPETPLRALLELSKTQLVEVIDFLALYDISEAVRHTVDKHKLTAIYRCLSPKKQQFLRNCLQKKERIAAPKLNIEKWDGNPETFNLILHRRGMFRLSKALCGQSPQFLWHICHILDIGRGKVIKEYYQSEAVPAITPVLRQQVMQVLDFFKTKSAA